MTGAHRVAWAEAVLLPQPARALLVVSGRSPTQMLTGLLTGAMPPDLEKEGAGVYRGHAPYSAMLTPKGRIVTDLRVARLQNGDEGDLLLDLPQAGVEGALSHFTKYLPPRLAAVREPEEPGATLTLVGPLASAVLSDGVGFPVATHALLEMKEGDEWIADEGSKIGLRVLRVADVTPTAFEILGTRQRVSALRSELLDSGVPLGEEGLWDVLRLERGRPYFGVEMGESTLPAEAGIQDRCVDQTKGCYTGQEVTVRIRDRGHVNRHLRGILLEDLPLPQPGAPLYQAGTEKSVGTIASSALSPLYGQGIALGYVRREVEPPETLVIETTEGPEVQIRALSDDGWLMVEGDATLYP